MKPTRHAAEMERVLAVGFLRAAPARMAQDVDGRREQDADALGARLGAHRVADALLERRVPGRAARHADREGGRRSGVTPTPRGPSTITKPGMPSRGFGAGVRDAAAATAPCICSIFSASVMRASSASMRASTAARRRRRSRGRGIPQRARRRRPHRPAAIKHAASSADELGALARCAEGRLGQRGAGAQSVPYASGDPLAQTAEPQRGARFGGAFGDAGRRTDRGAAMPLQSWRRRSRPSAYDRVSREARPGARPRRRGQRAAARIGDRRSVPSASAS